MSSQRVPGGVVHKLPADLRKALIANTTALDAWKGGYPTRECPNAQIGTLDEKTTPNLPRSIPQTVGGVGAEPSAPPCDDRGDWI